MLATSISRSGQELPTPREHAYILSLIFIKSNFAQHKKDQRYPLLGLLAGHKPQNASIGEFDVPVLRIDVGDAVVTRNETHAILWVSVKAVISFLLKEHAAADPNQLIEIEKTRMAELQRSLPELGAIFNKSSHKPKVVYYEGMEGIKKVYGDMLKEKKPIFAYEDLEHMKAAMPKSFYNYFPGERAKRGISFKSISRDSVVAREFTRKNDELLRETRFISGDDFKTEINIYGDKVALMSFRVHPPLCVLIQDENIAKTSRFAWQELWNRL